MIPKDRVLSVYIISFMVPIAFNLTTVALPLKALDVGLTRGTVSVIVLVSNTLQILGRPIAGYIGDTIGNKKPVILANIFYVFAFYMYFISKNIVEILVASLIQGLAVSFLWSSILSYIVKTSKMDPSYAIGSTLTISFSGGVLGLLLSGFIVELFGVDFTFLASTMITVVTSLVSLTLLNVGGGAHPSLKTVLKITFHNIEESFTGINSVAAYPLIRTYGTLLMLDIGLSEGIVGIILTGYRFLSVVMQLPAAKLYEWIIHRLELLNLTSLLLLLTFTYTVVLGNIPISVLLLLLSSVTSNLLPTGQLTKSTTENSKYSTIAVGGFGTGLSIVRLLYTSIASSTGYAVEQLSPSLNSVQMAMYSAISFFIGVTTLKIVYKRMKK